MITIPVMAYYHFGWEQQYYAGLGVTVGIPIRSTYKTHSDKITTQGYFPTLALLIDEPVSRAGLGDYEISGGTSALPLKTAFMLSAEVGERWDFQRITLYAGLYFDYGVNNISKGGKSINHIPYYTAGVPAGETYDINSLLAAANESGTAYSGKVHPMEAGIRIKIAFGDGKRQSEMSKFSGSRTYHRELQLVKATRSQESQEIKPENIPVPLLAHIQGIVRDEAGKPLFATVELTDKNSMEKVASVNSNSQDGTYAIDAPLGKNYGLTVRSGDKLLHSDNIDLSKAKKAQIIARNIRMQTIMIGASTVLRNIEFAYAKGAFTPSSIPELMGVVKWLNQYPSVHIEIEGHTDNVSSLATNMRLSKERAKAVYDFLILNGIDAERLQYKGYGPDKPISPNSTEEGRAKNRRVEMKITEM
jgi:outer membrane protein OmpA-like peptidoglycan-associated protein